MKNVHNRNYQKFITTRKKQTGATLFTSLVFLTLMTVVGVSASKVSIVDLLIAGNNQEQIILLQETENDLKILTRVEKLFVPLTNNGGSFDEDTGIYELPGDPNRPHVDEQITDVDHDLSEELRYYQCQGFSGLAISLGPDVPKCDLYDFQVKSTRPNSSVIDKHNRGAGKEKPNAKKNSYL